MVTDMMPREISGNSMRKSDKDHKAAFMGGKARPEDISLYLALANIAGIGVVTQNRLLAVCKGIRNCFSMTADEIMLADAEWRKAEKTETRTAEAPGTESNPDHCCLRSQYNHHEIPLEIIPEISRLHASPLHRNKVDDFVRERTGNSVKQCVDDIIRKCREMSIQVITCEDIRYPDRFRNLTPDLPPVLYARGDFHINDCPVNAGVIGARRCTQAGKKSAIEIAAHSVRDGGCVISGMAKGIDSYAHTAALKNGGYTIAVLGNGPDYCYPREHAALMERIIAEGALISEYPPGTRPRKYYFPLRNRIIAALSDTLYIIDAGRNSGTKSTEEYSKQFGRQVVKL